jgi:hypothetical protein
MKIFSSLTEKVSSIATKVYQKLLPTINALKATIVEAGETIKNLYNSTVYAINAIKSGFKSGLAGAKMASSTGKALFYDLPSAVKAAAYDGNKVAANTALQTASENFANAGNQLVESVTEGLESAHFSIQAVGHFVSAGYHTAAATYHTAATAYHSLGLAVEGTYEAGKAATYCVASGTSAVYANLPSSKGYLPSFSSVPLTPLLATPVQNNDSDNEKEIELQPLKVAVGIAASAA